MATILIVDDSVTEVQALSSLLEANGHATLTAADGELGLQLARSSRPDLVLMDVIMPGMNGFQATRKLNADPDTAGIPVVMLTHKDLETDREWGMRQGASEYVTKPWDEVDLIQTINSCIAVKLD